jgi:hypothetical protein
MNNGAKTATQIADGFKREDRQRAHSLRKIAYTEGFETAVSIIEGSLTAPGLSEAEIIQGTILWIKEMKETDHE